MPAHSDIAQRRLREAKSLLVRQIRLAIEGPGVHSPSIEAAVDAIFDAAVAEVRDHLFQGWEGWPT